MAVAASAGEVKVTPAVVAPGATAVPAVTLPAALAAFQTNETVETLVITSNASPVSP